jgi:hypothetical protein
MKYTLKDLVSNKSPFWEKRIARIQALSNGKAQSKNGRFLVAEIKKNREKVDVLEREISDSLNSLKQLCKHPAGSINVDISGREDDHGAYMSGQDISVKCGDCGKYLDSWTEQ